MIYCLFHCSALGFVAEGNNKMLLCLIKWATAWRNEWNSLSLSEQQLFKRNILNITKYIYIYIYTL